MTAGLVGTSGIAAIPTTALDLPLVQRLRRSPRFRVRVTVGLMASRDLPGFGKLSWGRKDIHLGADRPGSERSSLATPARYRPPPLPERPPVAVVDADPRHAPAPKIAPGATGAPVTSVRREDLWSF
jgi:hypothetical protein